MTISLSTNVRAAKQARQEKKVTAPNGYTPADGVPDGSRIYDPNHFSMMHASLAGLIKRVGDYLERTYPGWLWNIQARPNDSIIRVYSGRCHPSYGLIIAVDEIQDDPELREVKRLSGEYLERFGMPRRSFWKCIDEFAAAPKNVLGHLVPDLTDRSRRQLLLRERLEQRQFFGRSLKA